MLELKDVTMCYGDKTVFSGLSLRLDTPGRYAVLGASGCGKTTLLRLIAGLQNRPVVGLPSIPPSACRFAFRRTVFCHGGPRCRTWHWPVPAKMQRKPPAHGSPVWALRQSAARCPTPSPAA